jgi:hypothetical protein
MRTRVPPSCTIALLFMRATPTLVAQTRAACFVGVGIGGCHSCSCGGDDDTQVQGSMQFLGKEQAAVHHSRPRGPGHWVRAVRGQCIPSADTDAHMRGLVESARSSHAANLSPPPTLSLSLWVVWNVVTGTRCTRRAGRRRFPHSSPFSLRPTTWMPMAIRVRPRPPYCPAVGRALFLSVFLPAHDGYPYHARTATA